MADIPGNATTTATFEGDPNKIATFSGELDTYGDTDWIKVTLTAGTTYQFFGCTESWGGGNSTMALFDASGNAIAGNNDDGQNSQNSAFSFLAQTSGTYFLEISSFAASSSEFQQPGTYSLVVMFNETRTRLTQGDDEYLGNGNELIIGDRGDDYIPLSGLGFDALGEQGDDFIQGDASQNYISGGLGNDYVGGLDNNDRLFGDGGFDTLEGGAGDDLLYGGPGADRLIGNNDNDVMFGGDGVDLFEGGAGNDVAHVDNAADLVRESAGAGSDTIFTTVSFALEAGQQIEILAAEAPGGIASINLTGNEFANTLIGNAGANVLDGAAGVDSLRGALGNDTYALANGNDVVVDTGGAADLITSTVSRSLAGYTSIERLTLLGTVVTAGSGNNLANVIVGSTAANTLDGGFGDDTLIGQAGNDVLVGNAGRDVMTGGDGNDFFRYATNGQSPVGANADVITDFDDFGDDRIDLSAVYGGTLAYRHNLAFSALGQVRINDIAGADVIVEVNMAGGLGADMQIRLAATTLASMAANDFIL